jgi:hypothetical protein
MREGLLRLAAEYEAFVERTSGPVGADGGPHSGEPCGHVEPGATKSNGG